MHADMRRDVAFVSMSLYFEFGAHTPTFICCQLRLIAMQLDSWQDLWAESKSLVEGGPRSPQAPLARTCLEEVHPMQPIDAPCDVGEGGLARLDSSVVEKQSCDEEVRAMLAAAFAQRQGLAAK